VLSLRIATRFLRRSPGQTLLLIAGIAVGIGVQIFLGSLITSLQASLVDETIGSSSQVTVSADKEGAAVDYTPAMRTALEDEPQITTVVPVRSLSAIYQRGTESAPLNLTGGEIDQLNTIYKLDDVMVAGKAELGSSSSAESGDILVGKEFAAQFGLEPGDDLPIVLADGKRAAMTVTGVFDLGVAATNERSAFVGGDFAAYALKFAADQYTAIQTQVDKPFASTDVATSLSNDQAFVGLKVTDWQAENADLLSALRSQSLSSYMIQVFVLIAVALGIASTLAISAAQKTRQIGILKAMGLADRKSGLIFLWQAGIIGVLGSLAGVAAGLLLILVFWLAGRNSESLFPITPQVTFVVISFFVGVMVALLSSLIPSRRTSRVDPIEVIQSQ
jgi:lipoprotein-releasing system permease protein